MFTCKECGKKFKQAHWHKRHMRMVHQKEPLVINDVGEPEQTITEQLHTIEGAFDQIVDQLTDLGNQLGAVRKRLA